MSDEEFQKSLETKQEALKRRSVIGTEKMVAGSYQQRQICVVDL